MLRRFSKKAFTMIELVIVISIISVLSGMGGYYYSKSLYNAKESSVKSALEGYNSAISQAAYTSPTWSKITNLTARPSGSGFTYEDLIVREINKQVDEGFGFKKIGDRYFSMNDDPWGNKYELILVSGTYEEKKAMYFFVRSFGEDNSTANGKYVADYNDPLGITISYAGKSVSATLFEEHRNGIECNGSIAIADKPILILFPGSSETEVNLAAQKE